MDDEVQSDIKFIRYLESPDFLAASSNATRLVGKLKTAVQKQELYETHQIIRTIYFRFSNYREKLSALNELLYHGSLYLLHSAEFVSGQDAASLLLETSAKFLKDKLDGNQTNVTNSSVEFHRDNRTPDLDVCEKVSQIALSLPDTEVGRTKFVAEALKILTPKILNRDLLHNVLANDFRQHKIYASSRYHYLHCASLANAEDIACLLVEYHSKSASKSEVDLFLTQFILQFLCLQHPLDPPQQVAGTSSGRSSGSPALSSTNGISRKTRTAIKEIAEKIFRTYAQRQPLLEQVEIPFTSVPLLNFTYFIISILDSNQQEAMTYRILRDIYRATWSRDPNYQSYLNRIGQIYFGLPDPTRQQQQQSGGFFNNILMSLLDANDDDEEEEVTPSNAGHATNFSSCDELD